MILPCVIRNKYLKHLEAELDAFDAEAKAPGPINVTIPLDPLEHHFLKCIADMAGVPVEEMAYRAIENLIREIRFKVPGNH